MNSVRLALKAGKELGLMPLGLYARYQFGLRSGWFRWRTPSYGWQDRPLESWLLPNASLEAAISHFTETSLGAGPRFFFEPTAQLSSLLMSAVAGNEAHLLAQADHVLHGRFPLFGGLMLDIGFPPRWGAFAPLAEASPVTELELDHHWTEYQINSLASDVKLLWEPSRFGWIYPLARAYRLTAELRYFRGFLELVDSWRAQNAPNTGPHWISAQEVALRLLALAFGLYAFAPALADEPEATARLAQMITVHAHRILPTMDYARAQGNNHLLAEATALYTAGLLLPKLRPASRWRSLGRRWLVAGLLAQTYPDGGYVQHSTNYHRMALQLGLWAARLAEINAEPLPAAPLSTLYRSAVCLAAQVDPVSGRVPNLGPNDGTLCLPLTICAHHDYRPTLQAASALLFDQLLLPPGSWDEFLVWFGLQGDADASSSTHNTLVEVGKPYAPAEAGEDFPYAGFYVLRGERATGFLRCAYFNSRPGHADQLHFDLWRNGENLAQDAGSYLYNGQPPWQNALAGAQVHNTLVVDGQEPMRRAGRFLWLDWAQGQLLGRWRSKSRRLEILAGAHDGYSRFNVIHQRTIIRAEDDLWLIVDELLGEGTHEVTVGWLLPDWPWRQMEENQLQFERGEAPVTVRVDAPQAELAVYRAGQRVAGEREALQTAILGWRSPTYAVKEPAIHLFARLTGSLPLRIATRFVIGDLEPGRLLVEWRPPAPERIGFSRVMFKDEHLEV